MEGADIIIKLLYTNLQALSLNSWKRHYVSEAIVVFSFTIVDLKANYQNQGFLYCCIRCVERRHLWCVLKTSIFWTFQPYPLHHYIMLFHLLTTLDSKRTWYCLMIFQHGLLGYWEVWYIQVSCIVLYLWVYLRVEDFVMFLTARPRGVPKLWRVIASVSSWTLSCGQRLKHSVI